MNLQNIISFIFLIYVMLTSISHSEPYIEQFKYSDEFYEKPLILDYDEGISGVIQISPRGNSFSEYSWI